MKKTVMTSVALWMGVAAFAATSQEIAQGVDCEVFLTPYVQSALKDVSGKVVLDAGCSVTPNSDKALVDRLADLGKGMQVGEKVLVAAPASFDVVFTDGTQSDDAAYRHIQQVLASLGGSSDPQAIIKALSGLKEVMRATFLQTNRGLQLVTNERGLKSGQKVWCKTPEGVVSSVYHSEEDYLIALGLAGFKCEEIKRPCFFGKVKYDMWHTEQKGEKSLGGAYMNHNPFTLFYVVKRS